MSRAAPRSRWRTFADISVRGAHIAGASGTSRDPARALSVFAIPASASSQRAISFTVRSCRARILASPSWAFPRPAVMTAIVLSICFNTDGGAAASAALACVANHVARMLSICSTRPCASVAWFVSLPLSLTSLARMACQESARLARALPEGDDASVSVVVTWRLAIQSAARINSSSASRNSAAGACAERSAVVTCSARWAISGTGTGVIVLPGPCAD